MATPVDEVHARLPAIRVFTAAEADALVAPLEGIFARMDPKLARIRELRELVEDSEAYWGDDLALAPENDRENYARLLDDLDAARDELEADITDIRSLGAEPKDLHAGLVDFYARVNGNLAFLCWQRGEPRVAHWHTLEGGFAGRKPLEGPPKAEP